MKAVAPNDFRALARQRIPRFLFDYLDGGANDEVTLRRNRTDLERIRLRQHVLEDMREIDLTVKIAGREWRLPVALGPIGLAGIFARRGECQAARAADHAGVPFCLSTVSACSLGEVVAASATPPWFQLYMMRDRGFMAGLLDQAHEAGCGALVFTVDMPVPGIRYRDYRSGLAGLSRVRAVATRTWQAALCPAWAWDVGILGRPHTLGNVAPLLAGRSGIEDFMAWMRGNFDPGVTWNDLDFIREHWRRPLIIKGILDPDDARKAAALGADAIIVSNHGGRQLDCVSSTAKALPHIVAAVGDQLPLLVDGGVRSGLDVLRMLGLGAKAVLLGRAWAYALAAGGEHAVSRLLEMIELEMRTAMVLVGAKSARSIDSGILESGWHAA
jgi:L-lactate dehydrogenase (cytochrome)